MDLLAIKNLLLLIITFALIILALLLIGVKLKDIYQSGNWKLADRL